MENCQCQEDMIIIKTGLILSLHSGENLQGGQAQAVNYAELRELAFQYLRFPLRKRILGHQIVYLYVENAGTSLKILKSSIIHTGAV